MKIHKAKVIEILAVESDEGVQYFTIDGQPFVSDNIAASYKRGDIVVPKDATTVREQRHQDAQKKIDSYIEERTKKGVG